MALSIEFDDKPVRKDIEKLLRVMNKDELLTAIGLRQLRWIQQNFEQGGGMQFPKWRPLADNTVVGRRLGSAAILQDTGRLKQSFQILRKGAEEIQVGTRSQVAPYHEYGTRPYVIRPRRAKILRFMTTGGVTFSKMVHHPGLPKRQMLPNKLVAENLALNIIKVALKRHGFG